MNGADDIRHRALPGQHYGIGESISSADIRRLQKELDAALDSVEELARLERLDLSDDGLPVDLAQLKKLAGSPAGQNARRIERDVALVHALRQELVARREKKAAHWKRRESDARKVLRKVVQDAPAINAEFRELSEQVDRSWRLVSQFCDALECVAGSAELRDRHELYCRSVRKAAEALGIAAPELGPLSGGLPTPKSIKCALEALSGRGGYSRLRINVGESGRVAKLVDVLRVPSGDK